MSSIMEDISYIVKDIEKALESNPEAVTLYINGHLTRILPVNVKGDNGKNVEFSAPANIAMGPDKVPPFQAHIEVNNPSTNDDTVEGVATARREVLQLSDSAVPDTLHYVGRRLHLPIPSSSQCKKLKKINLHKFSSTWLSLSAKHINIRGHIDFESSISTADYKEPVCTAEIPTTTLIDHLPGVEHRAELDYTAELGLKEVLQKLGGRSEAVEVVGTRIALAMHKNETSWVLTNMAALYYRVMGDSRRALDCLRVALFSSPTPAKDAALLSTANILHRAGYINDAIVATSYCMEITQFLVVGHFNMANLYAAKGQWEYAAMFYESTLGLQSSFDPAKERLRTIQCMRLKQASDIPNK